MGQAHGVLLDWEGARGLASMSWGMDRFLGADELDRFQGGPKNQTIVDKVME